PPPPPQAGQPRPPPPHHPPHASPRSALTGDDHERTTEPGRSPEAGAAGALPRPVSSGELLRSVTPLSRGSSEWCSGLRLSVVWGARLPPLPPGSARLASAA